MQKRIMTAFRMTEKHRARIREMSETVGISQVRLIEQMIDDTYFCADWRESRQEIIIPRKSLFTEEK